MAKTIVPKKDIPALTDEQVLAYGNSIVPTSMIPAIWKGKTKRDDHRTAPIHARLDGKIHPMGRNRNRLYYWTHEVEAATPSTHLGKPPKQKQSDVKEV